VGDTAGASILRVGSRADEEIAIEAKGDEKNLKNTNQ
jgi:hypothetical protein